MKQKVQEELIYLNMTMKVPYKWRTGRGLGRVFQRAKRKRHYLRQPVPHLRAPVLPAQVGLHEGPHRMHRQVEVDPGRAQGNGGDLFHGGAIIPAADNR